MENLKELVNELRKHKSESEWIEFKHNNYDPYMIGQNISALANSATLHGKNCAYMLWGIDDSSHEIVGTDNTLQTVKKGGQELENWLRSMLSKNAGFSFESVEMPEGTVGVLIIQKAINQPVTFEKQDYIRIGSYTKKLNEYPDLQAQLWDRLRNERFEERFAKNDLTSTGVLNLLEYSRYFGLKGMAIPGTEEGILYYLIEEGCVVRQDNGLYAISNMGAILFARNLADFGMLRRKQIRVVQYVDKSRMEMLKDFEVESGYAAGFDSTLKYIEALLPTAEVIEGAQRIKTCAYPLVAVREAVANALIHQDFAVIGAGPTIEIFSNRIEITNPGRPLVDIYRIVDNPPRSRNDMLAGLMRRLRLCEEFGTGWDKIVLSCELQQLPAPRIELFNDSTRVTLFSEREFSDLSLDEKLWACYLHACIMYLQGEQLTNSPLRKRFGLKDTTAGSVSRLIKIAVDKGYIKPLDSTTASRYRKYLPTWA